MESTTTTTENVFLHSITFYDFWPDLGDSICFFFFLYIYFSLWSFVINLSILHKNMGLFSQVNVTWLLILLCYVLFFLSFFIQNQMYQNKINASCMRLNCSETNSFIRSIAWSFNSMQLLMTKSYWYFICLFVCYAKMHCPNFLFYLRLKFKVFFWFFSFFSFAAFFLLW